MQELQWLDLLGWGGAVGLLLFYWLLGSGKVRQAYVFGTAGALCWFAVGAASELGYTARMPSLVFMELMVVVMNVRGYLRLQKGQAQ